MFKGSVDIEEYIIPESDGFLIGASLPFIELERLPDALAQGAAACIGASEPPYGAAHSPFWYNPVLAGEIAAALRRGDTQGTLDGYSAFCAQAEAHTASFPYERAAQFRLLDEVAASAQADTIRLDWRLADRAVSAYSRSEIRASLQALLRAAAIAYQSEASIRLRADRAPGEGDGSRMAGLISHMQAHYADPNISLDSLSQTFGLSNRYISNLIHEATGMPYKDYLTELRMRRARELLAEGGRTVTEVSAMVGYASLASFIKMFRRVTGSAPARFARESGQIHP